MASEKREPGVEDDPVLFETKPAGSSPNVYGRYAVIVYEHARRCVALSYPFIVALMAWMAWQWVEGGGELPDVSNLNPAAAAGMRLMWPVMPAVSLAFIVGWPAGFLLSLSERNHERSFAKHGQDLGNFLSLGRAHITRSGERLPARVEAHREFVDVLDAFGSVREPEEARLSRRGPRGRRWARLRYEWIVCAWSAPDLVVVRFCWGPDLAHVWDVALDPASFSKGDADSFMRHLEPFYRFKRTSYRRWWGGARWSSPYASPNVVFKQRTTKRYRVGWRPRRRREAADGG